MSEIENLRLVRIFDTISHYNIEVIHMPWGGGIIVADCLSRQSQGTSGAWYFKRNLLLTRRVAKTKNPPRYFTTTSTYRNIKNIPAP